MHWFAVGQVFGSTAGVDIDFFGFTVADQFAFARLRDAPLLNAQVGASANADIDAIGAISSVANPEPGTLALMLAGLVTVARIAHRRNACATGGADAQVQRARRTAPTLGVAT